MADIIRSTLHASSYHDAIRTVKGSLTVQAVFQRAWHLHLRSGEVITVTVAPYDGPMCLRVQRASLSGLSVFPGVRGYVEHGALMVGSLRVVLNRGVPWRPYREAGPLPLIPTILEKDIREHALDLLWESADTLLDWRRRAVPGMQGLERALIEGDMRAARSFGVGLLGLGPGLTPSGDDILCGLLAGLHVLSHRRTGHASDDAAQLGLQWSKEATTRTSALSRTLLSWAARGVAVQPLLDVLWTLGSGKPVRGVGQLVDIGHSSGRDMLAGASLAARVIVGWEGLHGSALANPA